MSYPTSYKLNTEKYSGKRNHKGTKCPCGCACRNISLLLFFLFLAFPLPVHAQANDGFPVIGVLHEGKRPEGLAVDTQTHIVIIGYEYAGQIAAFDPVSGTVKWSTNLGDETTDVQVDSTTHRVYTVNTSFRSNQSILGIFDEANGKKFFSTSIGIGDDAIALDTKRQIAYVSDEQAHVVHALHLISIPAGSLNAEQSILKIGTHPLALGVNSRLGRLYVADADENIVSVYDEQSGRVVDIIPIAQSPVPPLRVDEATARVYIVCSDGQELDVLDGNTNTITAHVPVSPYPEGVDFSTATNRIYVADEGSRSNNGNDSGTTMTVIDGQSLEVIGTLSIGHGPDGVAVDPQLRRVYVTVEDSDAMVEISDSVDIPLKPDPSFRQTAAITSAIGILQQATNLTLVLMILTVVGATLGVLIPRWRMRKHS